MKKDQRDWKPKEEKAYESIEDWYQEVGHLKWPVIIFVILVLILIIVFNL